MRPSQRKAQPRKSAVTSKPATPAFAKAAKPESEKSSLTTVESEHVKHLRTLAHDLSNSLEAILQACYLLSHAKLDTNSRRWAQLIDTASQDAARTNREMRKALRSLSGE